MVRLFIALELSKKQKQEVGDFQVKAKKYLPNVRWVKPDNIHLTLKFIGETEEEKIDTIKKAIDAACINFKPFSMRCGETGVFPSIRKARVLWIGLNEGQKSACDLADKVEKEMTALGYRKEKRTFHPHLTIGRIRSFPPESSINKYLIEGKMFISSDAPIDKVVLFESNLTPRGAVYRPIYEKRLL